MARQWMTPEGFVIDEDGEDEYMLPGGFVVNEDQAAAAPGGRVMSSLAGAGGLAGRGGIAGSGGGLAA